MDDDDLPPREGASTPTTSKSTATASPSKPPTAADDGDLGSSELPAHAGFDFVAIKQVLGKSDLKPEEPQVPQPSRYPPPSIPPPTLRTESAPPPVPEPSSPATPKARPSLDLQPNPREEEPVAGPSTSPRTDLSSTLSRSLSLNNVPDAEEADMTSFGNSSSSLAASRQPVLSFGGNDGSVWPSQEPDPTPTYGSFGGRYPLSTNSSAMGLTDVLSNPFAGASGGLRSGALPSPSANPFASGGAPSLSFGGADGSISFPTTTSPASTQPSRSPWALGNPYGSGKKASSSTLDLNPWQS